MKLTGFLPPAAMAALLYGCGSMSSPQPQRVEGPSATISETGIQNGRTEVDMFVVTQVDGNDVRTSMDSTRAQNSGMGIGIVPVYVDHTVPARPITVTIMGHSYHGAPILSMLNPEYEVSGTVNFAPAPNLFYEVKGTLSAHYSAVWIEEAATGRIMGKKIEIHRSAALGFFQQVTRKFKTREMARQVG
jgi:hypothetical protein